MMNMVIREIPFRQSLPPVGRSNCAVRSKKPALGYSPGAGQLQLKETRI